MASGIAGQLGKQTPVPIKGGTIKGVKIKGVRVIDSWLG